MKGIIKRISVSVVLIGILLNTVGCMSEYAHTFSLTEYISDIIEVDVSNGKKFFDYDDHGGFLGDGKMVVEFSFSDSDCINSIKESSAWNTLPLTKNLEIFVYGGTPYSYVIYGSFINDEDKNIVIPKIENGYYCFVDRHSESADKKDDSKLLSRYSINCSLAIYDTDTDILYYLELDT